MPSICSRPSAVRRLAEQLVAGLNRELALTPKPGLVDRWDNGSHPDLSHALMERSIAMLDGYFSDYATALEAGLSVERLRRIGMAAEARMLAQLGTNTHRGAIFLGGLLLAGLHRADDHRAATVSRAVALFAAELFADRLPTGTQGAQVRAHYGVGGIIAEALAGLPSVFRVGLPAFAEARRLALNHDGTLYLVMARLMRTVQDTTALRRCGPPGLARLRDDGLRLEHLLRNRQDPVPFLIQANGHYRQWRLTMGGVADLMGVCTAWALFSRSFEPECCSAAG